MKATKINNNKVTTKQVKNKNKKLKDTQKLSQKMSKLKINDARNSVRSICPDYLTALLKPETSMGAKVPGMPDQTVAIHRKITITTTASALGAISVIAQPTFLVDTNTNSSTVFVNNDPAYNGIDFNANAKAVSCNFGVPPATVGAWRVVSFAAIVQPQSSNLNLQGTIHSSLHKTDGLTLTTAGTVLSAGHVVVGSLQNDPTYSESNVASRFGSRVIWVPSDIHLTQFKGINHNYQYFEYNMNEFVCAFVGVGLPANAPIRIDLYWNFEVVPYSTTSVVSLLQGMESICPHDYQPGPVWRQVFTKYRDAISMPYLGHNHNNTVLATMGLKNNDYGHTDNDDFLIQNRYKMQ